MANPKKHFYQARGEIVLYLTTLSTLNTDVELFTKIMCGIDEMVHIPRNWERLTYSPECDVATVIAKQKSILNKCDQDDWITAAIVGACNHLNGAWVVAQNSQSIITTDVMHNSEIRLDFLSTRYSSKEPNYNPCCVVFTDYGRERVPICELTVVASALRRSFIDILGSSVTAEVVYVSNL